MTGPGPGRLVRAALACYPASWRRRHGHEAADLAALARTAPARAASTTPAHAHCRPAGPAPARTLTPAAGRSAQQRSGEAGHGRGC